MLDPYGKDRHVNRPIENFLDNLSFKIGGLTFKNMHVLVSIYGETVLKIMFSESHRPPILVSACLYNNQGEPLIIIEDNIVKIVDKTIKDLKFQGNRIEIYDRERKIIFELKDNKYGEIEILNLDMVYKNVRLFIFNDDLYFLDYNSMIFFLIKDKGIFEGGDGIIINSKGVLIGTKSSSIFFSGLHCSTEYLKSQPNLLNKGKKYIVKSWNSDFSSRCNGFKVG